VAQVDDGFEGIVDELVISQVIVGLLLGALLLITRLKWMMISKAIVKPMKGRYAIYVQRAGKLCAGEISRV
jgi:hypothetical protein